ncbi:MAG: caspase family protein [Hyphomonadaceae bacterium]|nr:caspase family protein [Hyphomonadaceae bacterium]
MKIIKTLIVGFSTIILGAAMAHSANAEEKRLALLMANQDYPSEVGKLSNTHRDAAMIEASLKTLGYQITKVLDADSDGMDQAITNFERAIEAEAADGDDVVVFVYASMHGATAQVDGRARNFLLPAKESISTPGQLIRKGIRVDHLIQGLSASSAKAVVLVSDACRNELEQSFSKSTTKGFVPVRAQSGVVVAYATAPGSTTPDDGLFARVLAEELLEEERKASFAMLETIEEVAKQRAIDGQPYMTSGGLPDWFCFNKCPSDQLLTENEAIALGQALSSNSIAKLQEFRTRFPQSNFLDLIDTRIANVGPRNLKLTVKRIECLLADDEGPFNTVDMRKMFVSAKLTSSVQPMILYDWKNGEKGFSTGDKLNVNQSIEFLYDPRVDETIALTAEMIDGDPVGDDERGGFKDRAFPIDRIGQEQTFNISSRDFSFNIVYQFDEG